MKKDFEKAKTIGINKYIKELNEKIIILNDLLINYNDGRRKSFYCIAVNLLEINDIKYAIKQLKKDTKSKELSIKEKSAIAVELFENIAKEKNITLKLNS